MLGKVLEGLKKSRFFFENFTFFGKPFWSSLPKQAKSGGLAGHGQKKLFWEIFWRKFFGEKFLEKIF